MDLRVVVVGLGVQGRKRRAVAGGDVVATVDPVNPEAGYRHIQDVPLDTYDAALLCIPDDPKVDVVRYLLTSRKHALVEKPLCAAETGSLIELQELARAHGTTCYTAYNHRFEPHFARMKALVDSGVLGTIYSVRLFYGNGTARLVRNSVWRDQGAGVLPDLGSHLLDTILFWFGRPDSPLVLHSAHRFENRAPDHVTFGSRGTPMLNLEVTLLACRNHFYADLFAESGSAHIQSLCKWGPSRFTVRHRKFPSGRPDEETITLVQPDPTWELEYRHFKELCARGDSNIANDIWINDVLAGMCPAAIAWQP